MSSKEEWQQRLDEMFPDGVRVTQIEDVVDDLSDSFSFLSDRLEVVSADDDQPVVLCFPASFEKDVRFHIVKLEEHGNGYLAHTDDDELSPDFYLSRNFDEEAAKSLRKIRKERFEDVT